MAQFISVLCGCSAVNPKLMETRGGVRTERRERRLAASKVSSVIRSCQWLCVLLFITPAGE